MNLWKPTTGGWLTILNCVGWVMIAAVPIRWWHYPDASYCVLISLWFVLSLPVAWLVFIPGGGFRSDRAGIVATCCLIGFNSFFWGYGLAVLLRQFRGKRLQLSTDESKA